jgi:serine protease
MSSPLRRLLLLVVVTACLPALPGCEILEALLACDYEDDPECEDPERGQISGTLTITGAQTSMFGAPAQPAPVVARARALMQAMRPVRATAPVARRVVPAKRFRVPGASAANGAFGKPSLEERWRPGEVIVRAHDEVRGQRGELAQQIASFLDDGTRVRVGLCNTPTMCLAHLERDGRPLGELETALAADRLARFEALRWAEVNRVLRILRTPNDDLYPLQWHYGAMRLPAAWDITTGETDVVAAVIDTGILLDHPDLDDRVIGGADLIDDDTVSGDGDGRDDDGHDEGDNACGFGCHSHHGSHVAGTMAAETDNAQMVSGIAWQGSLLAVRVLGSGGGAVFDIVGGILWSVGEDVEGVSRNDNPADVLNMSLGGPGESEAIDEAVATATGTGALVIVAAGNDDTDASEFTPANAPEAITIAALGNVGEDRDVPQKASYSNYGDRIDVAAPGGEQAEDIDGDGHPDGVLSTVGDDVVFYQGTSMAAPHVAGLGMLMKSLDPAVDQDTARSLLTQTADDDIDCSQGCGAGGVNAVRVLRAMRGETGLPLVTATPAVTRVGAQDLDAELEFENVGDVATDVVFTVGGRDRERVAIDADSASLGPDESVTLAVTIDRAGDDTGEATVTATFEGGQSAEAQVLWTNEVVNVAASIDIGALRIVGDEITPERLVTTSAVDDWQYKLFNLTPGDYLIVAVSDDDNDGELEDHEGIGVYPLRQEPELVSVSAGDTFDGADFVVAPGFEYVEDEAPGTGEVGDGCEASADCGGELYCEGVLPSGYCTRDCSGGAECPTGSACYCLGDDGAGGCAYSICLKECVDDGDCRGADGYVCDVDQTCYPS